MRCQTRTAILAEMKLVVGNSLHRGARRFNTQYDGGDRFCQKVVQCSASGQKSRGLVAILTRQFRRPTGALTERVASCRTEALPGASKIRPAVPCPR